MFQNYFKMAWRNLLKNKGFSLINIFGLAIGVACCLLIMLYVANELSYDRWNPNADRIVRAAADIKFGGTHYQMATTGSVVGPDSGAELPEVESWCRIRQYGSFLVKPDGEGQQNIREEYVLTADSTFFELFPVGVIEGSAENCLTEPNTMAISRSRAEKYFESAQAAIGQTLIFDNEDRWRVTAVYEDMPRNTHFRADLIMSMNGNREVATDPPYWASNNNFHNYLLLHEDADLEAFRAKFAAFSREKIAVTAQQLMGISVEEFEASGQYARIYLQDLQDIHLHSDLNVELAPNGSIKYVWIFGLIAAFVLIIACINFMNLSTARSADRAKEIGVRKVMGSRRSSLIGQFLSESTLLAALAVVLAIGIAVVALPEYQELADRELSMPWGSPLFWLSLVGTVGVVGLLAGSYPAFFLSAFDTLKVLRGQIKSRSKGLSFRSVLVVFQFVTSATLILATLFVFKQLNYIQSKKVGFNRDQVIIVNDAYALGSQANTFKEEMLKHPAIESATVSSYLPVPSHRSDQTFSKARSFSTDNSVNMQQWRVDENYLNTLGMELAEGRNFDLAQRLDSSAVILNEAAAKLFGFDDPIGKKIYTLTDSPGGTPRPEDFEELTVIGVVQDFHWASMRENIGALSLRLSPSQSYISFRYKGGETEAVISALENQWQKMAPDQPFSNRFLDSAFADMYVAEQRIGRIAGVFALLSILVSCLGLFGLASYATEQRTKEIGIRKVLGASVPGIVGLLSKDFLKLVGVALIIAIPLVIYGMNKWLEDFAFRISLDWGVFILAAIIVLLIAFLTVSVQGVKAALSNPIKSLRSE
ncbi:ABC transporter permease [Flavilitoribacter nigricans]|uniref:Cell division protein FtsX n=1 Tax=Flavilitoribacter nigricans (strain ATCC 23147 / DSM 23189 / NBRC 102662 / NCIMB 1420 / SS-2) TaxID=1122177 RepID=A0A2D0N063_FLAN2|nr:ABC transporter permease [Flavilitoribacter nigricans]PHN01942.1 cell division protein FtsX [Flavilitoribacter nigricans DSM 23189 = NBRC 102662]